MKCLIQDNNDYNKVLRSLRKYNMLAYKKIIFDVLPQLRNGKLVGDKIKRATYRVELPCDAKFKYIHGQVYLIYQKHKHIIDLITIEPSDILIKLHGSLCDTLDGVPITSERDLFKLNLYKLVKEDIK